MSAEPTRLRPRTAAEVPAGAYRDALRSLNAQAAPYLVGGTFAFAHYTGIVRPTKDLDLFVQREDGPRVLGLLRQAGWATEVCHPHWLAKARRGTVYVDVIHGSGNGVAMVDRQWFDHAVTASVLGVPTRLVPPEEMIWSKAFVMEKYRFDGADVAHVLLLQGKDLDWKRLLWRFGRHWRVLLGHLVLFGFIYPRHRTLVPPSVLETLAYRLRRESRGPEDGDAVCQGVLLSRKQYRVDVESWGFRDARLDPDVSMTERDIENWTGAASGEPSAALEG
jgi:hypothetical protein